MYELALFSGAGGGILGGKILGWKTVGAVEVEAFPVSVLQARSNDGFLPPFPIFEDIREFRSDNSKTRYFFEYLREISSDLVISGGFPCQDISAAGTGKGLSGKRSGLWREMARIIDEVRPGFVFVENSPLLIRRGLAVVLGDFTEMGYDCKWCLLGADDMGAPHQRKRIWILAHSTQNGRREDGIREPGQASEAGFESVIQEERKELVENSRHGRWWAIDKRIPEKDIERELENGERENNSTKTPGSSQAPSSMADTHCQGLEKRESIPGNIEQEQPTSERDCIEWWDIDPAELPDGHMLGFAHDEHIQEGQQHGERRQTFGHSSQCYPIYDPWKTGETGHLWPIESRLDRVVDGMANRVDRIKAIGNGQVPAVAALAWAIMGGPINEN